MKHVLRLAGRDHPIQTTEDLQRVLKEMEATEFSDLALTQHVGSMKGFERILYRALGLATEVTEDAVHVLKNGAMARAIFLDRDGHEFRALASDHPVADGSIEFRLEDGSREIAPSAECISVERALEAVRYFFENGKRPDWFRYREVR